MVSYVYIHIPFCRSKCHYCSFVSYPKENLKSSYIKSLVWEISTVYKNELLQTLYFGGGTPSLLSVEEFCEITQMFNINSNTEVTAELNPEGYCGGCLSEMYLQGLKEVGINRLSIGAQTFNDSILKTINRRHNKYQIIDAIKNAKKVGFENISLDLMYGLPDQTLDMFLNDLRQACDLGVKHISFYGLSIEEGCYFYSNMPEHIADDDLQADMYLAGVDYLSKNGFNHYEFSNFSLDGFESRHNLNYWDNNEYYGFGTASHGYLNDERYSHTNSVEEYIENPFDYKSEYSESAQSKLEEEIFLGFRKMSGIDVNSIDKKYGINFEKKYNHLLKKYIKSRLLQRTEKGYAFTPSGVLVSNDVLSGFLE